jgi:hypothetical protein
VVSQGLINGDKDAITVVESEINDEYHGSDHCPLSLTLRVGGAHYEDKVERAGIAEKIQAKEEPKVEEKIIPKKRASVD